MVLALALGVAACTKLLGSDTGQYTIYGQGTQSCGAWAKAHDFERTTDEIWVTGFVSGAGWMGSKMRETDFAGIVAAMDKHCAEFPTDTIAEGAAAVAKQLRERNTR
jgi:hypothetical protein